MENILTAIIIVYILVIVQVPMVIGPVGEPGHSAQQTVVSLDAGVVPTPPPPMEVTSVLASMRTVRSVAGTSAAAGGRASGWSRPRWAR